MAIAKKKGFKKKRRLYEICRLAVTAIPFVVANTVVRTASPFLSPTSTSFFRRVVPFSFAPSSTYSTITTTKLTEDFHQTESKRLIRAIQSCTSVTQVQDLLHSTDWKPSSSHSLKHATSWSDTFPYFSLIAAAFCKSTKLIAAASAHHDGQTNTTLLPVLLKEIATSLVVAQRPSFQASLTDELLPFSMNTLSDLLLSFEWLALKSKGDSMKPLARSVLILMEQRYNRDGEKWLLAPFRIWECFQACFRLGLMASPDHDVTNTRSSHETTLPPQCVMAILRDRVTKGDVLAVLPARKLAEGLVMMDSLMRDATWNFSTAAPIVKAFSRRMRKVGVREHASSRELMQAIMAATQIAVQSNRTITDSEQQDLLFPELKLMAYTLGNELILKHQQNSSSVSFTELRRILPGLLKFQFHLDNQNGGNSSLVDVLCQTLSSHNALQDTATLYDMRDILQSLAYAKCKQPELFFQCGQRVYHLFLHGSTTNGANTTTFILRPKLLNSILRCTVLTHKDNQTVLEPFIATCRIAFLDEAFLAASSAAELSNFAWFLCTAHVRGSDHPEILDALARRILQANVVDTFTPKQAVSCLKAYVTLCYYGDEENSESNNLQTVVASLMEGLAGQLLSNQLPPAAASSALHAYARSNFLQDMGIFDHLTNVMAAQLARSSVRQVATSLWACGRMMRFERGHDESTCDEEYRPPYWKNAQTFFRFLAERPEQLNGADTSQALWAIGHLGVEELGLVDAILDRAVELTSQLSAWEIANIIWAMSKVLEESPSITITKRRQIIQLTQAILSLDPNPQEISNVLYALAVLDLADEATFRLLAQKMMRQMERAEAQAIYNALWAFQTSNLTPPPQLLDLWAAQKLGWTQMPTSSY